MYAWTGYSENGSIATSAPGPIIKVTKHKKIYIVWQNNIAGQSILPIDTTINPYMNLTTYLN